MAISFDMADCDLMLILTPDFLIFGPQGSSSFSFCGCLPSGWITLLLSGVITLVSENVLLDRDNFSLSFLFHLSVGLACFCVSSYVMYILLSFICLFFLLLRSCVEYICFLFPSSLLFYFPLCI